MVIFLLQKNVTIWQELTVCYRSIQLIYPLGRVILLKTLFILIGNGFTIDFIDHMQKEDVISVSNLFKFGSCVPWPVDKEPSFLSYKRCPNLWNLGARPSMCDRESIRLIEDIITCANVVDSNRRSGDNIYIKAYKELAIYLKHLFIYYNNKISDDEIRGRIDSWSWSIFLDKVYNSSEYKKIIIVTYNYDVWLERYLKVKGMKFNIGVLERMNNKKKITILKPHGSISFIHKTKLDKSSFEISYNRDLSEGIAKEFSVKYSALDEHYLINAMIPPAGDSGRLQFGWASQIRGKIKQLAKELSPNDEVITCGLSYWHVDRKEIDEIFTSINPEVTLKLVNPYPPRTLNSVLCSLFPNYINYTSSKILGG